MEISHARELVDAAYRDEGLLALYAKGDELSRSQTKHDVNHAFQVRGVAVKLTQEYLLRFPGGLTEWETDVVIPLAAFLHDIGRAFDVDNHAQAGARVMNKYLREKGFSPELVRRICKIIACHRSSVVLNRDFDDKCWAIVVIADKCVGDEDRVRPWQATKLRALRFFGLCRWWTGSPHDRVNFAIKEPELVVDGQDRPNSPDPGAIILKLRIDDKVCQPSHIYQLYSDRFHACGRAAQYLGFLFRLESNGERYMYSKEKQTWVPVRSIKVVSL
jgi:hypothetical protein